MDGHATGKGLNIKGKSARTGVLSGFVPFLQISEEAHKALVHTAPTKARIRVYYQSASARAQARVELDVVLDQMLRASASASEMLRAIEEGEQEEPEQFILDNALRYVDLWSMADPTIHPLDERCGHGVWGLDMPERLLWNIFRAASSQAALTHVVERSAAAGTAAGTAAVGRRQRR